MLAKLLLWVCLLSLNQYIHWREGTTLPIKIYMLSMLTLFESRYTLKGRYNIGNVGWVCLLSLNQDIHCWYEYAYSLWITTSITVFLLACSEFVLVCVRHLSKPRLPEDASIFICLILINWYSLLFVQIHHIKLYTSFTGYQSISIFISKRRHSMVLYPELDEAPHCQTRFKVDQQHALCSPDSLSQLRGHGIFLYRTSAVELSFSSDSKHIYSQVLLHLFDNFFCYI